MGDGGDLHVVAWAFAYAFVSVQVAWPGSFTAAVDPDGPRTWFELLFLSFTNLTSVGLSDITPILAQARSVVMIEQVAGLMYVAFVISRVVALTVTRQRDVARLTGVSTRRGRLQIRCGRIRGMVATTRATTASRPPRVRPSPIATGRLGPAVASDDDRRERADGVDDTGADRGPGGALQQAGRRADRREAVGRGRHDDDRR